MSDARDPRTAGVDDGSGGTPVPGLRTTWHDGVRTIALARPEVKNALTREVVLRMVDIFREATADPATRVVLLTGDGGSFCSGVDLKLAMTDPAALASSPDDALDLFLGLVRALWAFPRPVVALVDGPAVGFGCDLALACDLRIATDRAYFQEKFVRIGLVPDGGGTYFLPRLVGLAKAFEMMMLGDKVVADEALRLGLVSRVVPHDQAEAAAQELASRLAKGPPRALRHIKALIRQNLSEELPAALEAVKRAQIECLERGDFAVGVAAFFQQTEPTFGDDV